MAEIQKSSRKRSCDAKFKLSVVTVVAFAHHIGNWSAGRGLGVNERHVRTGGNN